MGIVELLDSTSLDLFISFDTDRLDCWAIAKVLLALWGLGEAKNRAYKNRPARRSTSKSSFKLQTEMKRLEGESKNICLIMRL
jgi:hypothetical protein